MYTNALASSRPAYAQTGRITEEGLKGATAQLSFDNELDLDAVDLSNTVDSRFIDKAAATD